MCPGAGLSYEVEEGSQRPTSAIDDGKRIRVIHCQATQSVLSYTCNKEGLAGSVKFDRFREPCRVTAAACQDATMTGMMRIGTVDYTMEKYH
jgi:hypothetical protein